MKTISSMFALLFLNAAMAVTGTGTSNGGDEIRANFAKKGQEIINYLKTNSMGRELVSKNNLDVQALSQTLLVEKIQVVRGPLVDNSGSRVDAIGIPGLIKLDIDRWITLLGSGNDLYYLIFHEMLRSAGVDDDNYKVSVAINPFLKTEPNPNNNSTIYVSGSEWTCGIKYNQTSPAIMTMTTVDNPVSGYQCESSEKKTILLVKRGTHFYQNSPDGLNLRLQVIDSSSIMIALVGCSFASWADYQCGTRDYIHEDQLYINSGFNSTGTPVRFERSVKFNGGGSCPGLSEMDKLAGYLATQKDAKAECQKYWHNCTEEPSPVLEMKPGSVCILKTRFIGSN